MFVFYHLSDQKPSTKTTIECARLWYTHYPPDQNDFLNILVSGSDFNFSTYLEFFKYLLSSISDRNQTFKNHLAVHSNNCLPKLISFIFKFPMDFDFFYWRRRERPKSKINFISVQKYSILTQNMSSLALIVSEI